MGEPRTEQADLTRRSRQGARRRSDQHADLADRIVTRRTALRAQPIPARGSQPSDAGWTRADRRRNGAPSLTRRFGVGILFFLKRTLAMSGILWIIIVG